MISARARVIGPSAIGPLAIAVSAVGRSRSGGSPSPRSSGSPSRSARGHPKASGGGDRDRKAEGRRARGGRPALVSERALALELGGLSGFELRPRDQAVGERVEDRRLGSRGRAAAAPSASIRTSIA